MCGILGVFYRDGRPIDRDRFVRALRTLERRGPDQEGVILEPGVGLGHRRLSILDLSERGRQPMGRPEGDIRVIFNGEIYNDLALRGELQGRHNFTTGTDTETLVHGYAAWGDGLLDRIEGMFAFGIHDLRKRRVLLARDHFGKKPLYYRITDECLAFASELKALVAYFAGEWQPEVDPLSVAKFLMYGYVPSPGTIFRGVKKLQPSSYLAFDLGRWRVSGEGCYWKLEDFVTSASLTEAEALEGIDARLREGVAKRLRSDVPVGIFLSGGVDSSLVASHVAELDPTLEAFTVCYGPDGDDERRQAEIVARRCGIQLHCCDLVGAEVERAFWSIVDYMDEPIADPAIIPLHFVARFARERITVVLSGDGGDELFGGYGKHRVQRLLEATGPFGALGARAGALLRRGDRGWAKLADTAPLPFPARQFLFQSGGPLWSELPKWMPNYRFSVEEVFAEAIAWDRKFPRGDAINRSLYLDCRLQLPDWYLVKGDRATMATSLEMRNPLLDKALAEFAFSIPGRLKIQGRETKALLKHLAERRVDREVVRRPKKGFVVPLAEWIRGELRGAFEDLVARDNGFLDRGYVGRLLDAHEQGLTDYRTELLRTAMLGRFLGPPAMADLAQQGPGWGEAFRGP